MCVVSMIGDHYGDKFNHPDWQRILQPATLPGVPSDVFRTPGSLPNQTKSLVPVDKTEFEALRKEVLEMKELLKKAVEYDKRNNEPHCELEEKVALLKKVAEVFGVDLSEVFKQ